jgi:hypothetical protein
VTLLNRVPPPTRLGRWRLYIIILLFMAGLLYILSAIIFGLLVMPQILHQLIALENAKELDPSLSAIGGSLNNIAVIAISVFISMAGSGVCVRIARELGNITRTYHNIFGDRDPSGSRSEAGRSKPRSLAASLPSSMRWFLFPSQRPSNSKFGLMTRLFLSADAVASLNALRFQSLGHTRARFGGSDKQIHTY